MTLVYNIVGLPQVDEYQEDGVLVGAGKILDELEFHGRSTCASPHAELVEEIVKLDAVPEAGIYDGIHDLP